VRLRNLLRGGPPASEARPRRRRRADGPRTIIPLDDTAVAAPRSDAPFAGNVDAARERLRRAIPPVADDEQ
jgi:hypothetical protein